MKAAARSRFHGRSTDRKPLAPEGGRVGERPPLGRFGRSSRYVLLHPLGGGEGSSALAVADIPARAVGALDVGQGLTGCLAIAFLALIGEH